jgi:hypothetical protein
MIYSIATRYEEFTLLVKVRTKSSEKIHLIVKDENQVNTVFTDRWKTVNGDCSFFVRMPVSGKSALIEIYNERFGKRSKDKEDSFEVVEIKKIPLEKKLDVVDFSDRNLRSFINFATMFCYNAGHLSSGVYKSKDGIFTLEYLPVIISNKTGKKMSTPARISKSTGHMQVAQEKFVTDTIPMRMAILLHEYSHFYVNDDINNESEADLNGLLIYLGLGYPRFEAHEAYLKTFIDMPTADNKDRYDKIKRFIDDFEKQNLIVYEQ